MALSKLQGPAHRYMEAYFIKVEKREDLGSWKDFVDELAQIYGQRDEKLAAKDELEALCKNHQLAEKDFIKYAECFRTLARIAGI